MTLTVILLGAIAFEKLSVREYPKIDPPVVSVRTVFKGATAEVIESVITTPIEDSLSGIEGIKTIKSQSKEEVSQVTVTFNTNRNIEDATNDVRDRVSRVKVLLPDQTDDPIVSKREADAWPVMWIAVTSDRHSPMELSDYADRFLLDPLKTVSGVATVIIGGERKYSMRIWLDRDKLAAFGLTAQDIEIALRNQNLDSPGGRIESSERELTVLAQTDLSSPEEFNNLIIKNHDGYLVRLKDVGYAIPGPFENRKIVRISGNEAIGLGVVKQSTGNTLAIAKGVKELVPKLEEKLPDGMTIKVAVDSSEFISAAIKSVYKVLVEALRALGATISYEKEEGYPPLRIKGKKLKGGTVQLPADISSQYISALLLIGPVLEAGLKLELVGKITSVPYIEMTCSLLKRIGADPQFEGQIITVNPLKKPVLTQQIVESDWSSASYFFSMLSLSDSGTIHLKSYRENSLQGDRVLMEIYEQLGISASLENKVLKLKKVAVEVPEILQWNLAKAPDIAQTIAVSCLGLGIGCRLEGLHTLKIKETDRLQALYNELTKLGASVKITADSLILDSCSNLNSNCSIPTYNDHRMAMAFAPLALKVPIVIEDAQVVSKSYPTFWEDLKQLNFQITRR